MTRLEVFVMWGVLGAVLVGYQVVALASRGSVPGVGAVVRRLIARPLGRAVFVLAWMWLGWHAFAR